MIFHGSHIHICPRCHVKMSYEGKIKAGLRGGLRRVYICPNCEYKTLMGEHLTDGNDPYPNSHNHPCPRCHTLMEKDGQVKEGPRGGLRRIDICPKCNYRTMIDEEMSAREIEKIADKQKKKSR